MEHGGYLLQSRLPWVHLDMSPRYFEDFGKVKTCNPSRPIFRSRKSNNYLLSAVLNSQKLLTQSKQILSNLRRRFFVNGMCSIGERSFWTISLPAQDNSHIFKVWKMSKCISFFIPTKIIKTPWNPISILYRQPSLKRASLPHFAQKYQKWFYFHCSYVKM